MECGRCGNELPEEALFCDECGARVGSEFIGLDPEKVEKMPEKIDEAIAKTIVAKGVFVEDEETGEPVAKECDCEKCAKTRAAGGECEGCGCGCHH